jgi:SEC-C motif
MALTVRLPDELQTEANRYAIGLGLSLNSLIAVALREYLDDRKRLESPPAIPLPAAVSGHHRPAPTPPAPATARPSIVAPANRRAPCPCGSGKRYSQCHGASDAQP